MAIIVSGLPFYRHEQELKRSCILRPEVRFWPTYLRTRLVASGFKSENEKAYYVLFVALKHIERYINTFCRKTQKLCTTYSLSQGGSVLNIFVSFRPFFQSKRVRDSKLCTAYPEFSKQPLHAGHAVITTSSNSVHLNPKQT